MILQRILNRITNKTANNNDIVAELGDGKAEFLGAGTYEEYENEQETTQTWREYLAKTLKIDR